MRRSHDSCESGPITNALGDAIRRRRHWKGFTLRFVAESTHLSIGYISQVEMGGSAPSIETIVRICRVLDVTLSQLFALAEFRMKLPDMEDEVLKSTPVIPNNCDKGES